MTVLFLYGETAIHAGTGSGLGAVDMPIQRERVSDYPIIQGSGIKGALRSLYNDTPHQQRKLDVEIVFGPDARNGSEYSGAVSIGDARILLFPVRSLRGVFVWVTSADVLARFNRDTGLKKTVPNVQDTALVSDKALLLGNQILLEEFSFEAKADDNAVKDWAAYLAKQIFTNGEDQYWHTRLTTHLVVLPNDDFRDFVKYSTEIVTRIRIEPETKTVAQGALFTQELLPTDTVLYSLVNAQKPRAPREKMQGSSFTHQSEAQNVVQWMVDDGRTNMQIGGDETIGRGIVRLSWGANRS